MAGNLFLFVLFLGTFAVTHAVKVKPCLDADVPDRSKCSIGDVRIVPCGEKECVVKLGQNATISFDFTPNFSATKLTTGVYYKGAVFPGISSEGCEYTGCPVESGRQQTFNFTLKIGKRNPTGKYTTDWKVWNSDDENDMCCFRVKIKLVTN